MFGPGRATSPRASTSEVQNVRRFGDFYNQTRDNFHEHERRQAPRAAAEPEPGASKRHCNNRYIKMTRLGHFWSPGMEEHTRRPPGRLGASAAPRSAHSARGVGHVSPWACQIATHFDNHSSERETFRPLSRPKIRQFRDNERRQISDQKRVFGVRSGRIAPLSDQTHSDLSHVCRKLDTPQTK